MSQAVSHTPGLLQWKGTPFLVAASGALLFLPWIGSVPLLDLDEPRYADCSRNMLETGDWLYPWFNGAPRHTKPAFYNWVQASTYLLLGVSEFTARLPSVLATVSTGLLIFFFTNEFRGRAVGLSAMTTWLLLPQSHLWAKMAITDAVLTFLLTVALMAAYLGMERSRGGLLWYAISGGVMGCAALTKGPVGIVVPSAAYLLYVLFTRSARRGLGHAGPYLALLVALLVAIPWYALQIKRYGSEYTDEFFGVQNVERYVGSEDSLGPFGWLWPIPTVLLFAFPTSVLLPHALKNAWANRQSASMADSAGRWRLFLAAWIVANLLLFAPSATRLPHYIMALYPAAAMLLGDLLVHESAAYNKRSPWTALALVVVGLAIGGGFAYGALNAERLLVKARLDNIPLGTRVAWVLATSFAVAGMVTAVAWLRGRRWGLLLPIWGTSLLIAVMISDVVWPTVGFTRDEGLRRLAVACRHTMPRDARIITYGMDSSTTVFYSRRIVRRAPNEQPTQVLRMLAERPGSRLIAHERWWPRLPTRKLRAIARARQYVLAELRTAAREAATTTTPPPYPARRQQGSLKDSAEH